VSNFNHSNRRVTHRERIRQALEVQNELSDTQLCQRTGIQPHQQVNTLCRQLEAEGIIRRERGSNGIIRNILVHHAPESESKPEQGSVEVPAAAPPRMSAVTMTRDELTEARDYYDEGEFPLSTLRRAQVNSPGRPQEAFALRLPAETVGELRQRAEVLGMGVTQLVREWVLERLELERRRPVTADALTWEQTRRAVAELLPEIVTRVAENMQAPPARAHG
jgi:hypothetical protein